MSLSALLATRQKLKNDASLSAFFAGRYAKDAKHFVGYKRTANANDYPFVAYVPVTATRPWC